jgi:hypothetical protein
MGNLKNFTVSHCDFQYTKGHSPKQLFQIVLIEHFTLGFHAAGAEEDGMASMRAIWDKSRFSAYAALSGGSFGPGMPMSTMSSLEIIM